MPETHSTRRLTAVMFTDIVGYTALMARSESLALRARTRHREVVGRLAAGYGGERIEETGDEILCTFQSALDAVHCALAILLELSDEEARVRCGIHSGDVVFEDGRVYGDGVNIAARIRSVADPGTLCVSEEVWQSLRNQPNLEATALGPQELRNVGRPVVVYTVRGTPLAARPRARPKRRLSRRRLLAVGAASALLCTAFVLALPPGERALPPELDLGPAPRNAVAVLPFADLSPEPAEYFADGLSEEIINALARVKGLRVAARTSAFAFKGKSDDVRAIGAKLAVGTVLEGSVRLAGDRVRVTAQVIDVSSGFHLWSETFDRPVKDVFAVQEEIARKIVEHLPGASAERAAIGGRYSPDYRAYELVLRGRVARARRDASSTREAIEHFQGAIRLDPLYAAAYAELAMAYGGASDVEEGGFDVFRPREEAAARRALELDEGSAEAHVAMGNILRSRPRWDWAAAVREFQRALELTSSYSPAYEGYSITLAMTGDTQAALAMSLRALEVDPLSPVVQRTVGRCHLYVGHPDTAVEFLHRSLQLNPLDPHSPALLWVAYHQIGRDVDAREALLLAAPRALRPLLRVAVRLLGENRLYRTLFDLQVLRTGDRCGGWPETATGVLAFLGDVDRMFECMQVALPPYVKVNPQFEPYRDDRRFREVLHRMRLDS